MSDPNDPTRGDQRNVHGTSTVTPVAGEQKKKNWLWWILGALALLALLFLLLRSCGEREVEAPPAATTTTQTTSTTTATAPPMTTGTPAVGVESVTLPGGRTIDLEPATLNYELQRFLASGEPAPRRFTFDRLNFATSSAELPADAQATTSALAQILTAYPQARVRVEGYADARGSDPSNRELGARRAQAVAAVLVAQGVAQNRIETATGGEENPVDTNATASGQAENRRTDLVVLSK